MKSFILTLILGLSAITWSVGGDMGAGTEPQTNGSIHYPWLIEDLADFTVFAGNAGYWFSCTKLMCDLDLSGTAYTKAVVAPDTSTSSGFQGGKFYGSFDGNNHVISNLTIGALTKDYIGLFGCATSGSQIKDLRVENINITGHNYVGGLLGENYSGTLSRCYTTGSVNGNAYVGGLVGENWISSISFCYATGSVNGNAYVGGLVGENLNGSILSCYSTGLVSGSTQVGGLVGPNSGPLSACFWDIESSNQFNGVGYGFSQGVTGKMTAEMQTLSTFTAAGWDLAGESANGLNDYWQINPSQYPCFAVNSWTLAGAGTSADPYIVANAADLGKVWLRPLSCYRLISNLDLTGISWSSSVVPEFAGGFDGQGSIISHLTINQANRDFIGLFGNVDSGGEIKNLGVENVNLIGHDYVGGLVGYIGSNGRISCCHATGIVSANSYVGGLAGCDYYATTSWCYATGLVSGTNSIGGLIGSSYNSSIRFCYATNSVSGAYYIGGLVGRGSYGSITSCYATGLVSGTSSFVGGLVGYSEWGKINVCFWNVQSSGLTDGIGNQNPDPIGVKGKTTTEMQTLSTFTSVGWDFAGESANGLNDYWQINPQEYPCFAVHSWTLAGAGTSADPYIVADAADLGKVWLRPSSCYRLISNLDLTGMSWSSAVIPEFAGVLDGQEFVISSLTITQADRNFIGLFGTVSASGEIKNLGVEDVNLTGYCYVGGLAGANSGTISKCHVTGSVNGDVYVGGLVGDEEYGSITFCYTKGSICAISYCGGLVGYSNHSTLVFCYATGSVSGTEFIGGLVGINSGTISKCHAMGSVCGANSVGGLVGKQDYGSITSCYTTGSVSATSYAGGLVGYSNFGTLTSCYATSLVSGTESSGGFLGCKEGTPLISSSFWDVNTSGTNDGVGNANPDPAGVIGKSTAQMMMKSTFAGWDFTTPVWMMLRPGEDYPRLAWQAVFDGDVAGLYGVDTVDLAYLAEYWGLDDCGSGDDCGRADIDGDGQVRLGDFAILAGEWLNK